MVLAESLIKAYAYYYEVILNNNIWHKLEKILNNPDHYQFLRNTK